MTEKRFTLTYEKIGKYFDMGIVDHEEPFDDTTYEFHQCSFQDSKDEMEDLTQLLNALHEENVKLRARNKYLATKIQKENEQLKHDATVLIQANQDYRRENEQLKTTISRLIEQNRKNNDLLVSDIRLLEKALWCPNCARNIKRLKELKKEFEND